MIGRNGAVSGCGVLLGTWAAAAVFAVAGSAAAQSPVINRVVLSGTAAPGAPGTTFAGFPLYHAPRVNSGGQLIFGGTLSGGGVDSSNRAGVWTGRAGTLSLVARDAQPTPAGQFYNLESSLWAINNAGQIALATSYFDGLGYGDMLWWRDQAGVLSLLARTGMPAPGATPPHAYSSLSGFADAVSINSGGTVAFTNGQVNVDNASTDRGVWLGTPGNVVPVAEQNRAAPGWPGVDFINFVYYPQLNSAGQVAVNGIATGANLQNRGVWVGTPGNLQLVAHVGQPAPGIPGESFDNMESKIGFNNLGEVSFRAWTTSGAMGLWKGTPGNVHLVAGRGDAVAGQPGMHFDSFHESRLNDAGDIAFLAGITDGVSAFKNGLFAGSESNLRAVALEGQHAPGTPAGVKFDNLLSWSVGLNNAGAMAFVGILDDPSTFVQQYGIWGVWQGGDPYLIVRTGQQISVGSGPLRTVQDIGVDLSNNRLNDNGLLAFSATFTDGTSGVFTVTVPEPGVGIAVVAVLAAVVGMRRGRRRVAGHGLS